jgi:hypothetical protein
MQLSDLERQGRTMETLIGFVAGYIAGCKDGPDGVKRLRAAAADIWNSGEVKRLAGEAMSFAEGLTRDVLAGRGASGHRLGGLSGAVGSVTEALAHRGDATGKGRRAA